MDHGGVGLLYALSCGQGAFPPNQQCGLAVADSPDGPFVKNRTMIDPYCEGRWSRHCPSKLAR